MDFGYQEERVPTDRLGIVPLLQATVERHLASLPTRVASLIDLLKRQPEYSEDVGKMCDVASQLLEHASMTEELLDALMVVSSHHYPDDSSTDHTLKSQISSLQGQLSRLLACLRSLVEDVKLGLKTNLKHIPSWTSTINSANSSPSSSSGIGTSLSLGLPFSQRSAMITYGPGLSPPSSAASMASSCPDIMMTRQSYEQRCAMSQQVRDFSLAHRVSPLRSRSRPASSPFLSSSLSSRPPSITAADSPKTEGPLTAALKQAQGRSQPISIPNHEAPDPSFGVSLESQTASSLHSAARTPPEFHAAYVVGLPSQPQTVSPQVTSSFGKALAMYHIRHSLMQLLQVWHLIDRSLSCDASFTDKLLPKGTHSKFYGKEDKDD